MKLEYNNVVMIGDGVNDVFVLVVFIVGIVMGGVGIDIVLEMVDVVLMGDDLRKFLFMVKLSWKVLNIIKVNIIFVIVIKFIVLLLVILGWLIFWIVIFLDMGVIFFVVLNSLWFMWVKD